MNISFYTVKDNVDTTRGYGVAGQGMVSSLQRLGHSVPFNDPNAPVQISLCNPAWASFHENQYKILYTPWESTKIPAGWREQFNAVDEVWATSQWVAQIYKENGVTKPIYVYNHGLDHNLWAPVERTVGEVTKFLHIGEPALRKGGQMALDAFREAFGDRDDVHLTIKTYYQHYLRAWKDGEHVNAEDAGYNNVTILKELMYQDELVQLYHDNDVLVYPSYGEGFGFIPLQALGTGMPVISTYGWAPYERFIRMGLRGTWNRSIWTVHPGDVLYPNYDDLISWYHWAHANLAIQHEVHYAQAPLIHEEYDWDSLTEKAFAHLENKF